MANQRLARARWTIALTLCLLALPAHRGVAQAADGAKKPAPTTLTTLSGVYSAAQARSGRNVFRGACESCHALSELTGPTFWNKVAGKPLAELFTYVSTKMPSDDPGSLGEEYYTSVLAFMLQLNGMPAGEKDLPADSTALAKILVVPPDTTKKVTPPRRAGHTGHRP